LKIFYAKLIYGASIPMLIYLGHKKTNIFSFMFASLLVDMIFVPLIFLVGWSAGKGFGLFESLFNDLRIILLVLVIFLILLYFIKRWMSKILLMRKQKLSR
jgi:membrane protein DedA with SNARE-associated domain